MNLMVWKLLIVERKGHMYHPTHMCRSGKDINLYIGEYLMIHVQWG